MKTIFILSFILLLLSFHSHAQQTIDKLNVNQLKLPKESANKALILDGAGQVKSSSTITDTELGYLEGLTDTLVNLLLGKANDGDVVKLSGNQSVGGVKTFTGKLVASSTVNGSIPCPVMTEVQRDAFTPVEGDCVYNSDTLKLNVFDGAVWKDVGGAGGISLWLTANPYNVNDIIIESDKIYRCLIAHTSGVFATDLAASKWVEVSSGLQSPVALADGGTGAVITPSAGSIVYVDADSFEQVSGTAGQVLQSNGSGAPTFVNKSISAKSQNNASVTAEEIQVPNNLLTQVDTNKHLNETGNKNILINPSFEHSTFSTGWTNSAGTFTQDTIVEIDGLKAAKLVLSSQTMSLSQSSTLYASQFADGVQGLASVRVKSDVALKVCSIQAGTVSTSNCVDVLANNKWGLYKVPFILGATSNGISIASNGSATGTVYIDDAFVGAVDLQATVDASKIAGEAYFAGTTSCSWARTSTTVGAFTATAACPGPTIVEQNMGSWQTTDSDLPKVTINNLPSGKYKAKFIFEHNLSGINGRPSYAIYDGNSFCYPVPGGAASTTQYLQIIECVFSYNQQGNRSFEIYGGSSSETIAITNSRTAPANGTKFILEYFGSSSVYSSTNADTDWASCNFSTLAWQGLGNVNASGLQCRRSGGNLEMYGKLITGTVSASSLQLLLPTWNGVQLFSKSNIPSNVMAGRITRNNSIANNTKDYSAIIGPSINYINVSYNEYTQATNPLAAAAASSILGNNETIVYEFLKIPIEGWENSNIIIGQFNGLESCTNTLDCTDVFSAKVSAAGVVSGENVDWISGNASITDTSLFNLTFNSGVFTVSPNCQITPNTGTVSAITQMDGAATASLISVRTTNSPSTKTAYGFEITCQKQGVDYIGKTAKAVASDQNLRSAGLTRAVINSCEFTSAGAFNNSTMCNAGFSAISKPATGRYQLTFRNTQSNNPVCTANNLNVGGDRMCNIFSVSTSAVTVQCENSSVGTDLDVPGFVICHGVE